MRIEFILGDPAKGRKDTFQFSCNFKPTHFIVLNNTSQPFFIRRGNTDIPVRENADYVVLPTSSGIPGNVALPTVAQDFAGRLDMTTPLVDDTQVVTVIIENDLP